VYFRLWYSHSCKQTSIPPEQTPPPPGHNDLDIYKKRYPTPQTTQVDYDDGDRDAGLDFQEYAIEGKGKQRVVKVTKSHTDAHSYLVAPPLPEPAAPSNPDPADSNPLVLVEPVRADRGTNLAAVDREPSVQGIASPGATAGAQKPAVAPRESDSGEAGHTAPEFEGEAPSASESGGGGLEVRDGGGEVRPAGVVVVWAGLADPGEDAGTPKLCDEPWEGLEGSRERTPELVEGTEELGWEGTSERRGATPQLYDESEAGAARGAGGLVGHGGTPQLWGGSKEGAWVESPGVPEDGTGLEVVQPPGYGEEVLIFSTARSNSICSCKLQMVGNVCIDKKALPKK